MGYGGPTVESSRARWESTQEVLGRGDNFLPFNPPRRIIAHAWTCCEELGMHKDWSCCTTCTKESYHVKGFGYSEATWSLPINTMTDECGIGYVSQWVQNHWRMRDLVCQRSNEFRDVSGQALS